MTNSTAALVIIGLIVLSIVMAPVVMFLSMGGLTW